MLRLDVDHRVGYEVAHLAPLLDIDCFEDHVVLLVDGEVGALYFFVAAELYGGGFERRACSILGLAPQDSEGPAKLLLLLGAPSRRKFQGLLFVKDATP